MDREATRLTRGIAIRVLAVLVIVTYGGELFGGAVANHLSSLLSPDDADSPPRSGVADVDAALAAALRSLRNQTDPVTGDPSAEPEVPATYYFDGVEPGSRVGGFGDYVTHVKTAPSSSWHAHATAAHEGDRGYRFSDPTGQRYPLGSAGNFVQDYLFTPRLNLQGVRAPVGGDDAGNARYTPPLTRPPSEAIRLSFYHTFNFAQGKDGGRVEVFDKLPAAGETPQPLAILQPAPDSPSPPPERTEAFGANQPAFTGQLSEWTQAVFDLSAWDGEEIYLGFHAATSSPLFNRVNYFNNAKNTNLFPSPLDFFGWRLDTIRLEGPSYLHDLRIYAIEEPPLNETARRVAPHGDRLDGPYSAASAIVENRGAVSETLKPNLTVVPPGRPCELDERPWLAPLRPGDNRRAEFRCSVLEAGRSYDYRFDVPATLDQSSIDNTQTLTVLARRDVRINVLGEPVVTPLVDEANEPRRLRLQIRNDGNDAEHVEARLTIVRDGVPVFGPSFPVSAPGHNRTIAHLARGEGREETWDFLLGEEGQYTIRVDFFARGEPAGTWTQVAGSRVALGFLFQADHRLSSEGTGSSIRGTPLFQVIPDPWDDAPGDDDFAWRFPANAIAAVVGRPEPRDPNLDRTYEAIELRIVHSFRRVSGKEPRILLTLGESTGERVVGPASLQEPVPVESSRSVEFTRSDSGPFYSNQWVAERFRVTPDQFPASAAGVDLMPTEFSPGLLRGLQVSLSGANWRIADATLVGIEAGLVPAEVVLLRTGGAPGTDIGQWDAPGVLARSQTLAGQPTPVITAAPEAPTPCTPTVRAGSHAVTCIHARLEALSTPTSSRWRRYSPDTDSPQLSQTFYPIVADERNGFWWKGKPGNLRVTKGDRGILHTPTVSVDEAAHEPLLNVTYKIIAVSDAGILFRFVDTEPPSPFMEVDVVLEAGPQYKSLVVFLDGRFQYIDPRRADQVDGGGISQDLRGRLVQFGFYANEPPAGGSELSAGQGLFVGPLFLQGGTRFANDLTIVDATLDAAYDFAALDLGPATDATLRVVVKNAGLFRQSDIALDVTFLDVGATPPIAHPSTFNLPEDFTVDANAQREADVALTVPSVPGTYVLQVRVRLRGPFADGFPGNDCATVHSTPTVLPRCLLLGNERTFVVSSRPALAATIELVPKAGRADFARTFLIDLANTGNVELEDVLLRRTIARFSGGAPTSEAESWTVRTAPKPGEVLDWTQLDLDRPADTQRPLGRARGDLGRYLVLVQALVPTNAGPEGCLTIAIDGTPMCELARAHVDGESFATFYADRFDGFAKSIDASLVREDLRATGPGFRLSDAQSATAGGRSWSYGDPRNGTVPANDTSTLELPRLDLSRAQRAVVSFLAKSELESGYDGVVLEASTDDGSKWFPLFPEPNPFIGTDFRGYLGNLQPSNPLNPTSDPTLIVPAFTGFTRGRLPDTDWVPFEFNLGRIPGFTAPATLDAFSQADMDPADVAVEDSPGSGTSRAPSWRLPGEGCPRCWTRENVRVGNPAPFEGDEFWWTGVGGFLDRPGETPAFGTYLEQVRVPVDLRDLEPAPKRKARLALEVWGIPPAGLWSAGVPRVIVTDGSSTRVPIVLPGVIHDDGWQTYEIDVTPEIGRRAEVRFQFIRVLEDTPTYAAWGWGLDRFRRVDYLETTAAIRSDAHAVSIPDTSAVLALDPGSPNCRTHTSSSCRDVGWRRAGPQNPPWSPPSRWGLADVTGPVNPTETERVWQFVCRTSVNGQPPNPRFHRERLVTPLLDLRRVGGSQASVSYLQLVTGLPAAFQLQIQVRDPTINDWSPWQAVQPVASPAVPPSTWSQGTIDLSGFIGQELRLGFLVTAASPSVPSSGCTGSWSLTQLRFDAETFTGDPLRLRLHAGTDANVQEGGWGLDDLQMVGLLYTNNAAIVLDDARTHHLVAPGNMLELSGKIRNLSPQTLPRVFADVRVAFPNNAPGQTLPNLRIEPNDRIARPNPSDEGLQRIGPINLLPAGTHASSGHPLDEYPFHVRVQIEPGAAPNTQYRLDLTLLTAISSDDEPRPLVDENSGDHRRRLDIDVVPVRRVELAIGDIIPRFQESAAPVKLSARVQNIGNTIETTLLAPVIRRVNDPTFVDPHALAVQTARPPPGTEAPLSWEWNPPGPGTYAFEIVAQRSYTNEPQTFVGGYFFVGEAPLYFLETFDDADVQERWSTSPTGTLAGGTCGDANDWRLTDEDAVSPTQSFLAGVPRDQFLQGAASYTPSQDARLISPPVDLTALFDDRGTPSDPFDDQPVAMPNLAFRYKSRLAGDDGVIVQARRFLDSRVPTYQDARPLTLSPQDGYTHAIPATPGSGCPFSARALSGNDDAWQLASVPLVHRIAPPSQSPLSVGLRSNGDGTTTAYDDLNRNGRVDPDEELWTVAGPPNPRVVRNTDGSCLVFDDRDGDTVLDASEARAYRACLPTRLLGETVEFSYRFGTNADNQALGFYIDSVSISAFRAAFEPAEHHADLLDNAQKRYPFLIKNHGNATETFFVEIVPELSTLPPTMQVSLDRTQVFLDEGESALVNVTLRTGLDRFLARASRLVVTLSVTPAHDPNQASHGRLVIDNFAPRLWPDLKSTIGLPGGQAPVLAAGVPAALRVTVQNDGLAPPRTPSEMILLACPGTGSPTFVLENCQAAIGPRGVPDPILVARKQVPALPSLRDVGPSLRDRTRITFALDWTPPSHLRGTFTLVALADAGEALTEYDRANNLAFLPVELVAVTRPDVSLVPGSLRVITPDGEPIHDATAGTRLVVEAEFENLGTQEARDVLVRLVNQFTLREQRVDRLPPGGRVGLSVAWVALPGNWVVLAEAIVPQVESDNANNRGTWLLGVRRAGVDVSALPASLLLLPGKPQSVSIFLNNTGDTPVEFEASALADGPVSVRLAPNPIHIEPMDQRSLTIELVASPEAPNLDVPFHLELRGTAPGTPDVADASLLRIRGVRDLIVQADSPRLIPSGADLVVRVENGPLQPDSFELFIETPPEWSTNATLQFFELSPGSQLRLPIRLHIPPDFAPGLYNVTVYLDGAPRFVAAVPVASRLAWALDVLERRHEPGAEAWTFFVRATNQGNVPSTFRAEFLNATNATEIHWSAPAHDVPPNESLVVRVTVQTSAAFNVTLQAASGPLQGPTATLTGVPFAFSPRIAAVALDPPLGKIRPGAPVRATIHIEAEDKSTGDTRVRLFVDGRAADQAVVSVQDGEGRAELSWLAEPGEHLLSIEAGPGGPVNTVTDALAQEVNVTEPGPELFGTSPTVAALATLLALVLVTAFRRRRGTR